MASIALKWSSDLEIRALWNRYRLSVQHFFQLFYLFQPQRHHRGGWTRTSDKTQQCLKCVVELYCTCMKWNTRTRGPDYRDIYASLAGSAWRSCRQCRLRHRGWGWRMGTRLWTSSNDRIPDSTLCYKLEGTNYDQGRNGKDDIPPYCSCADSTGEGHTFWSALS